MKGASRRRRNGSSAGQSSGQPSGQGGQGGGGAEGQKDGRSVDNIEGGKQPSTPTRTELRRKRQRRSTGGMSDSVLYDFSNDSVSPEQFKQLSTDDKLVTMFELLSKVHSMGKRLDRTDRHLETIMNETSQNTSRIRTLEYHSIDSEARNRRLNLIFRGIPEVYREENCFDLVRKFLNDDLELETADSIPMQRAHRIGAPGRNKTRPIIVCFMKEEDVQCILSNAHKLKGKPNLGVNRDYPKEIVQARSKLWASYKLERAQNPPRTVFIGYPAKLIVKGKVVQDEFPDWDQTMRTSRIPIPQAERDAPSVKIRDPVSTSNPFSILSTLHSEDSGERNHSASDTDYTDNEEVMDQYSQVMSKFASQQRERASTATTVSQTNTNHPKPNRDKVTNNRKGGKT